ncbi:MAG: NTP transferase domain-containing protein [Kiritimatiellae bacterium]|nr:NTP transferase domain-containing protein [Kiritimatiellia bacterium]
MNNSPHMSLVVLAAGVGSRYGGLKQLDPVGPHGEVILDYSVFDAIRAGFDRVVFVIQHAFEAAFRERVLCRYAGRVRAELAFQELNMLPPGLTMPPDRRKPWGTAHATLCAETAVGGAPFAVINADDFYGRGAYRKLADFLRLAPPTDGLERCALVGYRLRNTLSEHGTVARGVCRVAPDLKLIEAEELTAIAPHPDGGALNTFPDGSTRRLTGDEFVSMNMWGFRPSIFAHLRAGFERFVRERGADPKAEWYIPTAVTELIRAGLAECTVLPTDETWFGVTYREDKPRVEENIRRRIAAGEYPSPLWG